MRVGLGMMALACVLVYAVGSAEAPVQPAAQIIKGVEVSVTGWARAGRVSLTDCPAGANIVRGVIRPGEESEFVSVTIAMKVPASSPFVALESPTLTDAAGKTYRTAQAFAGLEASSSPSCTFSFRVPTGTKVAQFGLESATFGIAGLETP